MNNSRTKHNSPTSVDFGKVPSAKLPTQLGDFIIYGFQDPETGEEAVALVSGKPNPENSALVRIHSQCLTGDVFSSKRCDCGDQLMVAMDLIAKSGCGVLVYQQKEGRGPAWTTKSMHTPFRTRDSIPWTQTRNSVLKRISGITGCPRKF